SQLNTALQRTYQAIETRSQISLIAATLDDLEAGQRGYLMTGDGRYLDPYKAATAKIDQQFLRLAELTSRDPKQHRLLPQLRTLIAEKRAVLQKEIELRRERGFDAVRAAMDLEADTYAMDNIRTILAQLDGEEAGRLASHTQAQQVSLQRNFLMSAVFVAMLAMLFLIIYFLIEREMAMRTSYEKSLSTANEELETKVQERTRTLEQSHVELRELTAAIESVQEEERKRIARELHDDLGQQLTLLKMDVSVMKKKLAADQSPLLAAAERLDGVLTQTVRSARRIYAGLRPPMLDDLGLVPALEELVQRMSESSGLRCTLVADEELAVGDRLAMPLYRVAQESLNNSIKHAEATELTVSVSEDKSGHIVLRVEDNGKGMNLDHPPKGKTFGLIGMRERIYALGGEFRVTSEPGRGTTIEASVPKDPVKREA
ncbi:MAG TPA: CHASE3 domain-containing protein, partial [Burkholderiales bacterium]|nr:CHASE3 domain-containing protein [Burkholderiales bacterium]